MTLSRVGVASRKVPLQCSNGRWVHVYIRLFARRGGRAPARVTVNLSISKSCTLLFHIRPPKRKKSILHFTKPRAPQKLQASGPTKAILVDTMSAATPHAFPSSAVHPWPRRHPQSPYIASRKYIFVLQSSFYSRYQVRVSDFHTENRGLQPQYACQKMMLCPSNKCPRAQI